MEIESEDSQSHDYSPSSSNHHYNITLVTPNLPISRLYRSRLLTAGSFSITIPQLTVTVTSIILLACLANMTMIRVYGPKPPSVRLTSLTLSNLNVLDTRLAATWVANFTVSNPNLGLEVWFDRFQCVMFYGYDHALSVSSVEPFRVRTRGREVVSVNLTTSGWEVDQPIVERPVLDAMRRDQEKRFMRFSLRLSLWVTYDNGWGWTEHAMMHPYCLDLDSRINSIYGYGTLVDSKPKKCNVLAV